ncbi:MAG: VWA domain-containing protein [Bryobacterales bacterium]|nr:VWA domain-containing protein [Bryobacterales bacterium]
MRRILAMAAFAAMAVAQEQPVFRAETSLALVRFHVVRNNRYVDDLKPADILPLENGAAQKVALFEGGTTAPRTVPVDVILLFDTSGSVMQAGLLDSLVFQENLLDGLSHARLAVYTFARQLRRYTRPTSDPAELKRAFDGATLGKGRVETIKLDFSKRGNGGGTLLYEAMAQTVRDIAGSPTNATRLLLVFSDGFPTSNTKPETAVEAARESGIPVYPVVLGHARLVERAAQQRAPDFNRRGALNPRAQERLARIQEREATILDFADAGEKTGGRSFDPPVFNAQVVRQILQAMVGHIQAEYVAGYYPSQSGAQGKPRKVEVKLRSAALGKVRGGVRTLRLP